MPLKIISLNFWAQIISKRFGQVKSGDVELFLRIFNEYFHKFKTKYFLIVILIFVVAISSTAPVWLIKNVVNDIFVEKQGSLVFPLFLIIVLVFVIKGGSTYWQTVLSSQISNAMVADIQNRMFTSHSSAKKYFF